MFSKKDDKDTNVWKKVEDPNVNISVNRPMNIN